MKLAQILRKWRLAMEIDQKKLAKEIGINVSVLSRFETGECLPDARALAKILNYLMSEA